MSIEDELDKLHGNSARIDPNKDIISVYETITLTSKHPQTHGKLPTISEENVALSKEYVDENHK